jgi:hypothetical protein
MSAQIIVLAEHRAHRSHADSLKASRASANRQLATAFDNDPIADPYGLVAAVRALAASMEDMKGRSVKMQETYQSLSDGAQAVVAEKSAVAAAVDQLSDVRAFLARL